MHYSGCSLYCRRSSPVKQPGLSSRRWSSVSQGQCSPSRSIGDARLTGFSDHETVNCGTELAHRTGRSFQCRSLLRRQLIFDDLFRPASAQLDRHTDDDILQSIFAFAEHGTGQHPLLVFKIVSTISTAEADGA